MTERALIHKGMTDDGKGSRLTGSDVRAIISRIGKRNIGKLKKRRDYVSNGEIE